MSMRVLFVTSEIVPLVKTGGLADVSAALPFALTHIGVDVRVLLPGYPQVLESLPDKHLAARIDNLPGFPPVYLLSATLPDGVPVLVVECHDLYRRHGSPYQDERGRDWADNAERFGLLSRVAAVLGSAGSPLAWRPDVVHCNDWQAGLAPAYLHFSKDPAPSVMAVHNMAFQGVFPAGMVKKLGLPPESFQIEGLEYHGFMSFLKAGLQYATHITTVSPSYAREIQTDALGFGMQGLLARRRHDLTGILNGIDVHEWNPATDAYLTQHYDAERLEAKAANKHALQHRMNLPIDPNIPIFGLVSRFTYQKGVDVVLEIAPQLVDLPAQLVLLGSGDTKMQNEALALARAYFGQVGVVVGFEEGLSHLIEAGADIFLMPSRFEPCGLNQMYSQRYGTPPIVHATGGLIDTVVGCNDATLADGTATGFVFSGRLDAESLFETAQRAAIAYHNKKLWAGLQKNGMKRDFSWTQSALAYRDLYTRIKRA